MAILSGALMRNASVSFVFAFVNTNAPTLIIIIDANRNVEILLNIPLLKIGGTPASKS
jgi:hypothetical protein